MVTLEVDCGWCGRREADIEIKEIVGFWNFKADRVPEDNPELLGHQIAGRQTARKTPSRKATFRNTSDAAACGFCSKCGGPLLVVYEIDAASERPVHTAVDQLKVVEVATGRAKVLHTFPKPPEPIASANYPRDSQKLIEEIQRKGDDPKGIVMKCRAILEHALKKEGFDNAKLKSMGLKPLNLENRIEAAGKEGLLTKSLTEWAHAVRLDGNDSLHELKVTEDEVEDLVDFTLFTMEMLYDWPARIEARKQREKIAQANQAATPTTTPTP